MQLVFMAGPGRIEEAPKEYVSDFGPVKVNEKGKKPGVHCAGPA